MIMRIFFKVFLYTLCMYLYFFFWGGGGQQQCHFILAFKLMYFVRKPKQL